MLAEFLDVLLCYDLLAAVIDLTARGLVEVEQGTADRRFAAAGLADET